MNMDLNKSDLADNPTNRVPICLLLDISGSMDGAPINELNEGYKLFLDDLKSDALTKYSADLCVITFGGNVNIVKDFGPLDKYQFSVFTADGTTPMGEAVSKALNLLENRKQEYKSNMIQYFQPWLVILTDGYPTDQYEQAANHSSTLVNSKKLTVFPIGVGDEYDELTLQKFSPAARVLRLQGTKFKEFFQWLSASVQQVSASSPGDKIELDTSNGPKGLGSWANLDGLFD